MKKNNALLVALLIPVSLWAAEADKEEAAYVSSQAQAITYKVTLYREDNYDQAVWDKLVTDASRTIKRSTELEHDAMAATNEIVDAFVRSIEEVYKQTQAAPYGIHGQMSIEVADSFDEE